jgi:glyoxylase-like metal-dependent hydrolase (beta-lactamase superfamily II)
MWESTVQKPLFSWQPHKTAKRDIPMKPYEPVTSEIFQVGGGHLSDPQDAAVYLVTTGSHAAVIDAGCGASVDRIIDNIRSCDVDPSIIRYLLLTHCHFDHTGGADAFRRKTRCRIVAHTLDAVYLETGDDRVTAASWYGSRLSAFPVDLKLKDRSQTIDLGGRPITALHTPGHSPGSAVFVMESDGHKVLFGQDIHGPLDASLKSDKSAYQHSLREMLALEADILCEGHFGVYHGKERVRQFISSYLD